MRKKIAVVDEDLPRIIDRTLQRAGWTVLDVRDVGFKGKSDAEIISFARKSKAVLFTGDWDFAHILNFPPKKYYGIAILSFPNELSTKFIARETYKALGKVQLSEFKGNLVIIESGRIRIRRG